MGKTKDFFKKIGDTKRIFQTNKQKNEQNKGQKQ